MSNGKYGANPAGWREAWGKDPQLQEDEEYWRDFARGYDEGYVEGCAVALEEVGPILRRMLKISIIERFGELPA